MFYVIHAAGQGRIKITEVIYVGSCSLGLDGKSIGRVTWVADKNGRITLHARCPFEAGYIYRVFVGGGGHTLSVGVMAPDESGAFFAAKTFTGRQTAALEAADVSAWVVRALPGEPPAEAPAGSPSLGGINVQDTLLKKLAEHGNGAYQEAAGRGSRLVFPFSCGEDSVFAPFFWAAEVNEGRACILLDQNGIICVPQSEILHN